MVSTMSRPPVICVVGRSNSGKTTLIVALVRELKRRGYRVATVKHASHGFAPDRPGKDSWRHINAGADAVAVVSPDAFSIYRKQQGPPPDLHDVMGLLGEDFDLILVEGYSTLAAPKIEVVGQDDKASAPGSSMQELLAIVARQPTNVPVPQFQMHEIEGLADMLAAYCDRHIGVERSD